MKINGKTKEILSYIAVGAIILVAASTPRGSRALWKEVYKRLKADTPSKKRHLRMRMKTLEKEGIITLVDREVRLSKKGRQLVERLRVGDVTITHHPWDGIWRLVSYDIPTDKKSTRDALRRQLQTWGFKLVHKSLWVLPWECRDDVAAVARVWEIQEYVVYMVTEHLPMETRLKEYYRL